MITNLKSKFAASKKEIIELFRLDINPEAPVRNLLWFIGALLTPFGIAGALFGYVRAYNRFQKSDGYKPSFANITPIVRFSMIIFGAIGFFLAHLVYYSILRVLLSFYSPGNSSPILYTLVALVLLNLFLVRFVFLAFNQWKNGVNNMLLEGGKYGTATYATAKQLQKYTNKKGIYIGGNYVFSDKGHILTKAGTRGGKGVNVIIQNLLGLGGYCGSWVVIDPKGENAAITARYQRESGQNVVVLNPWGLLEDKIGEAQSFNPLDILSDKESVHFVDDIAIIAEMIVPVKKGDADSFFTDNARSIVAGLLLYLMTTGERETQVLATIWKWVRYQEQPWNDLLADMATCDDETNGETIRNAAGEILKLMQAGDKTYGSIIATVLQETEFLKSPALQKSMQSGFSPYQLADGTTTLYLVIPVDKLKSQPKWLRLVITSMMRAVVRKPNKRVTFLLDEFASLGYLAEIELALSAYAGFNITIWAILQDLNQLKGIYSDRWESFIANCTIRQFFSVKDNFSADYISKAIGQTSNVIVKKSWFGISESKANPRDLVTSDEVKRGSEENIFGFFGELPVTVFPKFPYYYMSNLIDNGIPRYDDNPYYTKE